MKCLVTAALMVGLVALVSAQGQRPAATLDDLLTELRGLRADINQTSAVGVQAQVLIGRLQLQEQRVSVLSSHLFEARRLLAAADQGLAPMLAELNQAEDSLRSNPSIPDGFEQHVGHLRSQASQAQSQRDQLRREESDLASALAGEQNRWLEFNGRLDEIERGLAQR